MRPGVPEVRCQGHKRVVARETNRIRYRFPLSIRSPFRFSRRHPSVPPRLMLSGRVASAGNKSFVEATREPRRRLLFRPSQGNLGRRKVGSSALKRRNDSRRREDEEKKESKKRRGKEQEDGMWARERESGFPDGDREENMWVR